MGGERGVRTAAILVEDLERVVNQPLLRLQAAALPLISGLVEDLLERVDVLLVDMRGDGGLLAVRLLEGRPGPAHEKKEEERVRFCKRTTAQQAQMNVPCEERVQGRSRCHQKKHHRFLSPGRDGYFLDR